MEERTRETQRPQYPIGKLSQDDTEIFIRYLNELIMLEKDVEAMKIELALREDFNLIDAFGILDPTGKGFISKIELREGLMDFGLKLSTEEVHLF
eukprot:CAMPEP_0202968252 /NCGR_PEP_ID=MMETSP1396-20130829/13502_1 /ASSEMBLY_ACC=CAM_ASM_000872 /TAXON_ID= /ORGANISM="Pseudokeronopsis sp., Strain Brazil" /LENGTH=94 /DNA_ID=CAMNT_0049694379 /DNA_START=1 /DNA_END=282 /DNA_ORIENTATION=+